MLIQYAEDILGQTQICFLHVKMFFPPPNSPRCISEACQESNLSSWPYLSTDSGTKLFLNYHLLVSKDGSKVPMEAGKGSGQKYLTQACYELIRCSYKTLMPTLTPTDSLLS